ncbi:MAG: NAD(P)H-binding protein [Acidimicrobiia bacterium]|nr:NAD(P)H-binding protein [Acidimicrobiia bacterium]
MPVIVIGADTASGRAIADGLSSPGREIRVFVSDEEQGADFKDRGFKVAVGDVSDESHVEGAALNCFTAVLIAEAAKDGRERSFATSHQAVVEGWARAVGAAGVRRVVWVTDAEPPETPQAEVAAVAPGADDLVSRVVAIDDAQLAE